MVPDFPVVMLVKHGPDCLGIQGLIKNHGGGSGQQAPASASVALGTSASLVDIQPRGTTIRVREVATRG
ncbi:hypothetical protein, partial [Oceanicoccus sp.]|uniref:hypothetical protein n=1 Tax=Oceanicoccus sp. TaxID=2691044 RepID=UPI00262D6D19